MIKTIQIREEDNMSKSIAMYRVIEKDIFEKIQNGYYKRGDKIPTEKSLSELYSVSRVTVRRATDNLVAKGYLKRTPGMGTIVSNNIKTLNAPMVMGFENHMKEIGKEVETFVNTFSVIKANEEIAGILDIKNGDNVYYIERVRNIDGISVLFEITYISVDRFPELSMSHLNKSKFNFFIDTVNIEIDYHKHIVRPALSSEEVSEIFEIVKESPIVIVDNYTYCKDGSVIDYSINYFNPKEYELCYIKHV